MADANDKAACCVVKATCGDKNGAAAGTDAVSTSDCGAGFVARGGSGASECVGAACDMSNADDKAACCVAKATCDDKNGAADVGSIPVSTSDCGAGFVARSGS